MREFRDFVKNILQKIAVLLMFCCSVSSHRLRADDNFQNIDQLYKTLFRKNIEVLKQNATDDWLLFELLNSELSQSAKKRFGKLESIVSKEIEIEIAKFESQNQERKITTSDEFTKKFFEKVVKMSAAALASGAVSLDFAQTQLLRIKPTRPQLKNSSSIKSAALYFYLMNLKNTLKPVEKYKWETEFIAERLLDKDKGNYLGTEEVLFLLQYADSKTAQFEHEESLKALSLTEDSIVRKNSFNNLGSAETLENSAALNTKFLVFVITKKILNYEALGVHADTIETWMNGVKYAKKFGFVDQLESADLRYTHKQVARALAELKDTAVDTRFLNTHGKFSSFVSRVFFHSLVLNTKGAAGRAALQRIKFQEKYFKGTIEEPSFFAYLSMIYDDLELTSLAADAKAKSYLADSFGNSVETNKPKSQNHSEILKNAYEFLRRGFADRNARYLRTSLELFGLLKARYPDWYTVSEIAAEAELYSALQNYDSAFAVAKLGLAFSGGGEKAKMFCQTGVSAFSSLRLSSAFKSSAEKVGKAEILSFLRNCESSLGNTLLTRDWYREVLSSILQSPGTEKLTELMLSMNFHLGSLPSPKIVAENELQNWEVTQSISLFVSLCSKIGSDACLIESEIWTRQLRELGYRSSVISPLDTFAASAVRVKMASFRRGGELKESAKLGCDWSKRNVLLSDSSAVQQSAINSLLELQDWQAVLDCTGYRVEKSGEVKSAQKLILFSGYSEIEYSLAIALDALNEFDAALVFYVSSAFSASGGLSAEQEKKGLLRALQLAETGRSSLSALVVDVRLAQISERLGDLQIASGAQVSFEYLYAIEKASGALDKKTVVRLLDKIERLKFSYFVKQAAAFVSSLNLERRLYSEVLSRRVLNSISDIYEMSLKSENRFERYFAERVVAAWESGFDWLLQNASVTVVEMNVATTFLEKSAIKLKSKNLLASYGFILAQRALLQERKFISSIRGLSVEQINLEHSMVRRDLYAAKKELNELNRNEPKIREKIRQISDSIALLDSQSNLKNAEKGRQRE